jgi:hypothetical protein
MEKRNRLSRNPKGYVFTITTFLLLTSLLLLAGFFSTDVRPVDLTGPKLAMLYDDIRGDVVDLLDVSAETERQGNTTVIIFNDTMPSFAGYYMSNYENYIEMNYTKHVGEPLDQRHGSLAGADAILNMSDPTLYIYPYRHAYGYNNLSKNSIYSYPLNNSSDFIGYSINATLNSSVTNVETDLAAGNVSLHLSVYGLNYTYDNYLTLSGNATSWLEFETPRGNFTVDAGMLQINNRNETNAVGVSVDRNLSASVLTTLAFNQTPRVSIDTGFGIELRDITRKAFILDKIWFLR